MRKSKFSEQQIAFILRQAEEGTRVEEVCRKAGISQQTYYRWRKKYGGLMPSEMRRLKQLEEENARLKRLVADLSLDKEMLQEVVRKNVWSAPGLQPPTKIIGRTGLLPREGWKVNHKRIHRLYAEEELQLRNKTPKRKVSAKLRDDRSEATVPNEV